MEFSKYMQLDRMAYWPRFLLHPVGLASHRPSQSQFRLASSVQWPKKVEQIDFTPFIKQKTHQEMR